MPTLGSLFAGIGGFDLGFERAGFETVWQVEIDPTCRRLLARHFPRALRREDVRECGAHHLPPVDVITFGSPCQDLSLAGKRKGLAGERSGLFFEAIRIIRECRPALAVWENVPGALSSHAGRDFGAVLAAFRECGARDLAWRVLDSKYFGVAQRRRRVFLVADFRGERAGEILFEPEGVRRNPAAGRAAGEDVAGRLGGGAESRGWSDDTDRMTFVPFRERGLSDYATGEFGSLRHFAGGEAGGGSETLVAHAPNSGGFTDPVNDNVLAFTERTRAEEGMTVRRLTPTECERLQGFPDGWTAHDAEGQPISDSARYRMLGNAVTVSVVRWIALRLQEALR
jgi:DNA (cytosine-5)-methyltransferase 1